jgi:hypothetical protein
MLDLGHFDPFLMDEVKVTGSSELHLSAAKSRQQIRAQCETNKHKYTPLMNVMLEIDYDLNHL